MKFKKQKGYIAVYGETWPLKITRFVSGHHDCKVSAFAPFIFFQTPEYEWPYLVRHELIHFRQYYETLYIGLFILAFIEKNYLRFVKGLKGRDGYLAFSLEQEAYLNHHDEQYLKNRRPYSFVKYIFNKTKFSFVRSERGEVVIEDKP